MKYYKTALLMGTDVNITIFCDKDATKDIDNIFSIFYSLELEFSRFLTDSSLNTLNTKRTLKVSDRFIEVLKKSKEIYIKTDFYFNPLISLKNIGYSKSFNLNQFQKEIVKVNLDFEKVDINGNIVTLQEDQILDLGGIVKGFGVDMAKKALDEKGYKNYIIDAGGDIYVSGLNENGKKILVGIDDPFIKGDLFAMLELENKAIATSGNYKRKWTIENKEYNHIINPITSKNNNEITSITLIAEHSYISDAYATACIAMGIEKALEFLKNNKIDGLIISQDKTIYTTDGMKNYNIQII